MTFKEYSTLTPDQKRRTAAEIIGFIDDSRDSGDPYSEDVFGGMVDIYTLNGKEVYLHEEWKPDESLDQVAKLEDHYCKISDIDTTPEAGSYSREVAKLIGKPETSLCAENWLFLDADKRLFCIFQAFGIKLEEARKE